MVKKKKIRGEMQDLKIHPSHSECSDNEFRNQPQKQNPTCQSLPAVCWNQQPFYWLLAANFEHIYQKNDSIQQQQGSLHCLVTGIIHALSSLNDEIPLYKVIISSLKTHKQVVTSSHQQSLHHEESSLTKNNSFGCHVMLNF